MILEGKRGRKPGKTWKTKLWSFSPESVAFTAAGGEFRGGDVAGDVQTWLSSPRSILLLPRSSNMQKYLDLVEWFERYELRKFWANFGPRVLSNFVKGTLRAYSGKSRGSLDEWFVQACRWHGVEQNQLLI